jgi:hypothetical protein
MPQSERSQIIKEMLMWIDAKTRLDGGVRRPELIRFVQLEITSLGAATKTVEKYLNTLVRHHLVTIKGQKYVCTQTGKNWLEKKVS